MRSFPQTFITPRFLQNSVSAACTGSGRFVHGSIQIARAPSGRQSNRFSKPSKVTQTAVFPAVFNAALFETVSAKISVFPSTKYFSLNFKDFPAPRSSAVPVRYPPASCTRLRNDSSRENSISYSPIGFSSAKDGCPPHAKYNGSLDGL